MSVFVEEGVRCVVLGVMGCGAAACVWEPGGMLLGGAWGVLDRQSVGGSESLVVTVVQMSSRRLVPLP